MENKTKGFCDDCPDREACFQGMSCELSKKFAAAAAIFQQKMKGNTTMSAKNTEKVTAESVVAKAAEEKLVTSVPAQSEKSVVEGKVVESSPETETPELTVIEGDKKPLKDRVVETARKLAKDKNVILGAAAIVGTATLVFVKYAKKKAEEALVVVVDEEVLTEDEKKDIADELAAGEIGG